MDKKISLSTGRLQRIYGDKEALTIAKRVGCDAIDFDTQASRWDYRKESSVYARSDEEICEYFAELRRHADAIGLEIGQTHGRIQGFKNIKEEDDALIRNARFDCMAASILGAPTVIIHSATTIHLTPEAPPSLMHDLNADMFERIIPFAKEFGVRLASETFGDAAQFNCCDFFGNIGELMASYDRVCSQGDNAKYMSYCVDTGHSNKATRFNGNPSAADVIRMLGKDISTLHLNDNDTLTDQHKPPRTGTIDWHDVLDALDEVKYSGNYNMEINLRCFGEGFEIETAEFSVKLMRHLLREHYGR